MLKILNKILKYPFRYKVKLKFIKEKKLKNKFSIIYNNNYWDNFESKSGPGSSLKNTNNLRIELPKIIKKYKIKSILDAPCGDCNWIKDIIYKNKIKYTGIDIVKECINDNKKKFKNKNFTFKQSDITKNKLPYADLFICRDFLFHLSFKDSYKFFKNLRNVNCKYLLFSNHAKHRKTMIVNKDINSGDFRKINIFRSPYNIQENYEKIIDDNCDGVNKYLILFKRKKYKKFFEFMIPYTP